MDRSPSERRGRYLLGLLVLVAVVVLWVASSMFIQAIFNENFQKPFFLTYFSTSLFALYLPSYWLTNAWKRYRSGREEAAIQSLTHGTGQQQLHWKSVGRISLILCPNWFLMNYLFNWSLSKTTTSSNTILSSTSGLFVVVLSAVWLKERVQIANVAGVLFTLAGAVCVGFGDQQADVNTVWGDVAALSSAVMYAVYSLLLRRLVDEDRTSMQLLFGCIGVLNMLILWPFFFILNVSGLETFAAVPNKVLLMLFINGLFGTVISDFMWAKAVILTSPLICTIALTMTIPLAMVADFVINQKHFSPLYITGSVLVFVGFVLVNWKFKQSMEDEVEYEAIEKSDLDYEAEEGGLLADVTSDSASDACDL